MPVMFSICKNFIDGKTNGTDRHRSFTRSSNQTMRGTESPAQNKSSYNTNADTLINNLASTDSFKDGKEIQVSREEVVSETTSTAMLASNVGSYQAQQETRTLPGSSGLQLKSTVGSNVSNFSFCKYKVKVNEIYRLSQKRPGKLAFERLHGSLNM